MKDEQGNIKIYKFYFVIMRNDYVIISLLFGYLEEDFVIMS